MAYRRGSFALTPPSIVIFIISLVLALVAFVVHYGQGSVPLITQARAFDALAIGYILLALGALFRGI